MTFKHIIISFLSALTLVGIVSCGANWRSNAVRITVAVETNAQLVLVIENPTAHVVLFDDPRFSRTTRFDWELCAGQKIVAQGGKGENERDPLLVGHLSTGPFDIGPKRPLRCDLRDYYPELGNGEMVSKADSFMWYCRIWDQTSTNWIQASGMVRLRSITVPNGVRP